ncbi:hypothetical protein [Krasilnikovia cinnamomea]|uniref:hypothetical protein n=1 Tax=Krasilnikovia cinnamomea TaxID=349313 RepID=UPI00102AD56B|nr:hypothetical protein [Krasilnikovia cinnamomea]
MRLRFLGKDSTPSNSPTLYASDNDSYVVQGWVVTDPGILARLQVSDAETVVEVPARLLSFLALDGLDGEVTRLVPPIVHVLDSGNFIIQGQRVEDREALGQMTSPDDETCVEVPKAAMRALLVGA